MLFVDGEYLQTEAKGLGVRNADKNKPTMAKSLVFAATETSCVRYSGLAHFATLIWPTWLFDILPHFRRSPLPRTEGTLVFSARR
jgi:hypothetical protein